MRTLIPGSVRIAQSGPASRALAAAFLLAAACILASCELEPSSNENPFRDSPTATRDSAGIEIVESFEASWSDADAWRVSEQPDLSIGVIEGDPVYQFSHIRNAVRAPDGRIVVADGTSREIRVYDDSGRHVRTLGGRGSGPGEFEWIDNMILRRDTVIVFDSRLRRLTSFLLSGRYLSITRVEATGDPIHPLPLYSLMGAAENRLLLVARGFPANMRPEPVRHWDTLATLRYSRAGALLDTVGEYAGMDTYSTPTRAGHVTFGRFSSSDVSDDLLYMTDGGGYEVRVYKPGRGLSRILRRSVERRPVTEAILDDYVSGRMSRIQNPADRRQVRQHLEDWPHAERLPWISDIEVDEDGHVWVREYQNPYDSRPERWGVFHSDGRWLGRVTMPAGFTPTDIGASHLLGIAKDELEVEYVRQYRLLR